MDKEKEKDLFEEIVKDKLTNYTLPVEDNSWDMITERLNHIQRKRIERRWIGAIAVAASIALLFLLFPINKKTYNYATTNLLPDHEETIVQAISEKTVVQSIPSPAVEPPALVRKSRSRERLAENELATEVIPVKEITDENPSVTKDENPSVPTKEEPGLTEKKQVFPANIDFGNEEQIPVIKRKKRQSVRFSIGSGRNLLANNSTEFAQILSHSPEDSPFSLRSSSPVVYASKTQEILAYEEYPNESHHLPLSFGVTVKKELNRTFAVESGIVYSFVANSYSREFPRSEADLQLHYVGIPLNIHTRIFGDRFSQWEVYLSTGGMVEKGVLSHFVQKTYYDNIDNQIKTVVSDEKIKGLQWSLGISPGVDYKIHTNYSIYFEPRLSYYFDNNQPVSARTNNPLIIGINAGVRYTW